MRTESQILKDFRNMSWEIIKNDEHKLILENELTNAKITLYKHSRSYECAIDLGFTVVPSFINFQEHKLLHELFEILGDDKIKEQLYQHLFCKYGVKQLYVAIEELSELQKELCKAMRAEKFNNKNEIIEEIADVSIMLEQLISYFNIDTSEIKKIKGEKIMRTIKWCSDCEKE